MQCNNASVDCLPSIALRLSDELSDILKMLLQVHRGSFGLKNGQTYGRWRGFSNGAVLLLDFQGSAHFIEKISGEKYAGYAEYVKQVGRFFAEDSMTGKQRIIQSAFLGLIF